MADITEDCIFNEGFIGTIKVLQITTPSSSATGDTIDLGSDVANGRGVKLATIKNTLLQDDAGADKTCTWNPSTGIITLGSITTGIHDLIVWGV